MKPYLRITLIYFLFGAGWIFISDRVLEFITSSADSLSHLQTYKGWFFIFITSLLLLLLIRKSHLELETKNREKVEVFDATIRAMHHILNNFLQKMTYFKVIAETSHPEREEALKQYDAVIQETAGQILKLGEISQITPKEIEKAVFKRELKPQK